NRERNEPVRLKADLAMWIFIAIGAGVLALAHTAPVPFLFDAFAGRRAIWHMPRTDPPTIYLTFDDGPNPTTTPDLLDVLARERIHATFFLIDRHITDETAPIVRRIAADGHAIARSEEHTSELQSPYDLVCRLLLEKKKNLKK